MMFSMINISGLALGLTCSILIALWIRDEYAIDNFHQDIDRLFVVTSREYSGTEIVGGYDTPGLLGEELKKVFPEVEYACNYAWVEYNTLAAGDKRIKVPGNFAGPDFFQMFSYPLILGTTQTALKGSQSIAISRSVANRLFGSPEQAMGQGIRFENYKDLKVTAVFENLSDNTSERFQYMINWEFFTERNNWILNWNNSGPFTFLKLRQQADADAFASKIRELLKQYDKEYSKLERLELGIQPFGDRYLHSNFESGYQSGGRIEYVQMFQLVAVFILVIACINFMNLSTARSIKRAKEIGVRKVIGAFRGSLISQFMIEAFLFTILSVVVSIILVQLALSQFNLLTAKNLPSPVTDPIFWKGLGILTLVTALISGSYPAFLLSGFKPIAVLKSNLKLSASSGAFRKGLVVFQFALSMIFIVGMIVINQQVNYVQNKNLGYEKNNLIYLRLSGALGFGHETFKQEALKLSGVENVTLMSHRPVGIDNSTGGVQWEGKAPDYRPTFTQTVVGYDFIKTMNAKLVMGRDFSVEHADSANYIINETALKAIGYKDPIGMPLTFWDVKGTIIGVVKDFHFNSLHVPIRPLVIRLNKGNNWGYLMIRTEPGKILDVVEGLEGLHKKFNPEFPFAHQFADEEYSYLYTSEHVIRKLSGYFAFLAIFISCLGLLGLVIFTAEQRTKEIGIRKVLGANISQLMTLLSKDFLKLVLISAVVASPIAYFAMTKWLRSFEYHIEIQWWIFVVATLSAVVIALLTVIFHSTRAALVNPVNSLKSE
jgi:putative ABC transport system permease protein